MSALGVIALLGATMLALGGVLAAFRDRLRLGLLLQAAGIAVLGVAGILTLTGGTAVGSPFTSSLAPSFGSTG